MSLKNSLYHIISRDDSAWMIRFNAEHPVFTGHFPGYPIVPGACLVQIAEELLSDYLDRPVRFASIRNLKFKQPVMPEHEVTITVLPGKDNIVHFYFSILNSQSAQFATTYMCADTDV